VHSSARPSAAWVHLRRGAQPELDEFLSAWIEVLAPMASRCCSRTYGFPGVIRGGPRLRRVEAEARRVILAKSSTKSRSHEEEQATQSYGGGFTWQRRSRAQRSSVASVGRAPDRQPAGAGVRWLAGDLVCPVAAGRESGCADGPRSDCLDFGSIPSSGGLISWFRESAVLGHCIT